MARHNWRWGICCIGLFGLSTLLAHAGEAESAPNGPPPTQHELDLARLERRLDRLEEERRAQELSGQRREPRQAELLLSGYVQVDWVAHEQSSEDELAASSRAPLNQERFLLRRGRLRAEAIHGIWGAALELDANTINGPQIRPVNAEISASVIGQGRSDRSMLTLHAGLIRIPFGFEVMESDLARPFLERAGMLRALFPGQHDLGAMVRARSRYLELNAAATNGSPIGSKSFALVAPTHQKELLGRISTRFKPIPAIELAFGMSALTGTGFHSGSPTTKDQLVWRDDNGDGMVQATEIGVVAGTAATPSRAFHRFALGGDLQLAVTVWRNAATRFRFEAIRASNLDRALEVADPVDTGYDLREWGWYVGATQGVTQYCNIGVRYDYYQPDNDARAQVAKDVVPRDRSYSTLALTASVAYEAGRIVVEYDINRNALGRDINGQPTNLKSNALIARGEVRF